ncbi:hypothetical protein ACIBF1_19325 [Spirillospora sp. NPDC050679]
MGDFFTDRTSDAPHAELSMSNGAIDVFLDVLTLAGSRLARGAWEQHLVLYLADGQRVDRGVVGFDLGDLPWTDDCAAEKRFLLAVVDLALSGYGWERLSYHPARVEEDLTVFRSMVAAHTPVPSSPEYLERPTLGAYYQPDWRVAPDPDLLALCPLHDVCTGAFGCRICVD